jgi:hypothetical protein
MRIGVLHALQLMRRRRGNEAAETLVGRNPVCLLRMRVSQGMEQRDAD